MVEEYVIDPPWEAPRSSRNPLAIAQQQKNIEERWALGMLRPATDHRFNTPLHGAADGMKDGVPNYRWTVDTSRRKRYMVKQDMAPGVLSLDDTLRTIESSEHLSSIDMANCFYQFELAEESRPMTAFTDGLNRRWESTVLGMGSPNSVAHVQRHMRSITSVIAGVIPYVDDIPLGDQGGSIPVNWDRKLIEIPPEELKFEHMMVKIAQLFELAEN